MRTLSRIFLVVMLLSAELALAKDEPPPKLELSIHAVRSKVASCEPLWVTYEMENIGERPANVHPKISVKDGVLTFYFASEKQSFKRFYQPGVWLADGGALHADVAWSYVVLSKGEYVSGGDWILFNMAPPGNNVREFVLNKPGRYRLKAAYEGKGGIHVESEPVTIEVESPPQSEDEAYRFWSKPEMAEIVQGGWGAPEAYKDLKKFIEKYPKSLYAPYAALAMAEHWLGDPDAPNARANGLKYLDIAMNLSAKSSQVHGNAVELKDRWSPKKYDAKEEAKKEEEDLRRIQSGEFYNITPGKKKRADPK